MFKGIINNMNSLQFFILIPNFATQKENKQSAKVKSNENGCVIRPAVGR